jgi:hypothetical protein
MLSVKMSNSDTKRVKYPLRIVPGLIFRHPMKEYVDIRVRGTRRLDLWRELLSRLDFISPPVMNLLINDLAL